jgi:hypothetical protein
MKRGTVTGEVKSILSELGVQYDFAYSDNYAKNRVGAKLVGVYLTDDQKEIVKNKMIERGFEYSFIRENDKGYNACNGTRFCFYNKI